MTWADGDVGERQIVVPIGADSGYEKPEWFAVVLESPEGGAGPGQHGAMLLALAGAVRRYRRPHGGALRA